MDVSNAIASLDGEKFDLIFADPPYVRKLLPDTLRNLVKYDLLKLTTLIICESATPEDVFGVDEELAKMFFVRKSAKYGAAHITILMLKEA